MNKLAQLDHLLKSETSRSKTQEPRKNPTFKEPWSPIAKFGLGILGGLTIASIGYYSYQFYINNTFEACLFDESRIKECVKTCEPEDICKDTLLQVAQSCAGNQDSKCQVIIKEAFEVFSKTELGQQAPLIDITKPSFTLPKVWQLAQSCFGKENEACKIVTSNILPELAKNNLEKADQLTNDCFGNENFPCPLVITRTHSALIDNNSLKIIDFAKNCFNKENATCKKIIKETFPKLLEKYHGFGCNLTYRTLPKAYLNALMETDDPTAQQVLLEALPSFYKKDPLFAERFVDDCAHKIHNKTCKKVVETSFTFFLKHDIQKAKNLINSCKNIRSMACLKILKNN